MNYTYEYFGAHLNLRHKMFIYLLKKTNKKHDKRKKKQHGGINLFKCLFFNTAYTSNDGKECNLTNTALANRTVFVLQMRTSCSDHNSPTKCLTGQKEKLVDEGNSTTLRNINMTRIYTFHAREAFKRSSCVFKTY